MDLSLKERVAIVTGASSGLGTAIARALAAEGACVLAVGRNEQALRELEEPDGRIIAAVCDVRDHAALERLPDVAVSRFGSLEIVINNAGIAPAGNLFEQPAEVWDEVMDVNLRGPMALTRVAGKVLTAQGHGKVVNIASTAGLKGKPLLAAYSASKGGLLRFTEAIAAEWARFGVQVNAIAPGAFETPAQAAVLESPDALERRLRKIPARRMGRSEEIGPLVCYLASARSDFVTGAIFVIDGGEVSHL
jgi:2-dehydro-3-deoxy-D-gluconate 5-dehydrogenase